VKLKPEKNSGLNGIRTHDLCDTGAVLITSLLVSHHFPVFIVGNYWNLLPDEDCLRKRRLAGLPLFTLREIEVSFKDSGKTAKLNKRTEQLSNENFHDNISCLNMTFLCLCHLWSRLQKKKPQTKLCPNEVFCSC